MSQTNHLTLKVDVRKNKNTKSAGYGKQEADACQRLDLGEEESAESVMVNGFRYYVF